MEHANRFFGECVNILSKINQNRLLNKVLHVSIRKKLKTKSDWLLELNIL